MHTTASTPNDIVNELLAKSKEAKHRLLVIFSGEDCKWCKRLKELLEDNVLQNYCKENAVDFSWVTLPAKKDEDAASCSDGACKITTRRFFGITSIPTAVLFDDNGATLAKLEFIDAAEQEGGQAYVTWLKDYLLF